MPRPKKEENKLDAKLDKVLDILTDLNNRVVKLETPAIAPAPVAPPPSVAAVAPGVPVDYVKILHTTLNEKFGIEVEGRTDMPQFILHIIVPEEYSNAGKPHWETYHEDRRSRVIDNALGINGVKEWIEKVYNSFNPEVRAMITQARV